MPRYIVHIQKINHGIECTLKKGKAGENSERACADAYFWWRRQLMAINQVDEDWFKWKESTRPCSDRKTYFCGLEPVGFVVEGTMQDTGSMPTEYRAQTLKIYQSALTQYIFTRDGEKRYAWWTDVEVTVEKVPGHSYSQTVAIRPLPCTDKECQHPGENPVGLQSLDE